jgi:uncharacterized repeat protein (TIGR04138 family)
MESLSFDEAVRRIVAADSRYHAEAYLFMQQAIHHTQKSLGRQSKAQRHVAGKELLEGIRECALATYGPMTPTVLAEWGIRSCEDFGEIVFNLIDHGQATQSETDSREDFKDGYEFDDAFRKPFLPSKPRGADAKLAESKMISQD